MERVGGEFTLNLGIDATGRNKRVGKTIVVQVDHSRAPAHISGFNSQTRADGDIVEVSFSIVAVKDIGIVGEVALEHVQVSVEIVVANSNPHAGLLQAVFAQSNATLQALFAKCTIMLIAKEPTGRGIAGYINVGPTIVIVVRGDCGHGIRTSGRGDAGHPADIGEGSVAINTEYKYRPRGQAARTAIHGNTFPGAVRVFARLGQLFERGVEIVSHEQVQPSVAIVVYPGTAGAVTYGGLSQSGSFGHL